ncbi:MAG TPA: hypothetical protein VGA08_04200 [Candidatus Saccharimonadales bacterium]
MSQLDRLLKLYLELEHQVLILREKHGGMDNVEEDIYLDVMDSIWWKLTETERDMLNSRPADKRGKDSL